MKKLILFVLTGLLLSVGTQAQGGFTIHDLHEWSKKGKTSFTTAIIKKNHLMTGERLNEGEKLQSTNGGYYLIMQDDGNLAIYDKNGRYKWDAGCGGNGSGSRLDMQTDGNLVVYNRKGAATWSSKTHPYFDEKFRSLSAKPVKVVLENDGVLTLYNRANKPVWTSTQGTDVGDDPGRNHLKAGERLNEGEKLKSSNGAYYLIMQNDGNVAIYDKNNGYQWDAGCGGNGAGSRLDMQTDGNLVVYNRKGDATWSSQTHPYFNEKFRSLSAKPVRVVLENDGRLILYNSAKKAMWSNK